YSGDVHGFVPMSRETGKLRSWINLTEKIGPDPTLTYVIGCDISNGTGATNSVASVGCIETGEKVAEYADAHMGPREFGRFVVAMAKYFRGNDPEGAYLIWEGPGPGVPFGKAVQEAGYRRVYTRKKYELGVRKSSVEASGWW